MGKVSGKEKVVIELISGVTFRRSLLEDAEVEAAISRGEVPQVPMKTAKHTSHACEEKVQAYLLRHGIPTCLIYQSTFVGSQTGTAVSKEMADHYGIPLVVQPALATELVVACLGDLQNVVCSIFEGEESESGLDDRIVNLAAVEDAEATLRELSERALEYDRTPCANPVYVEARIYRRWLHSDFVRPCLPSDYRTGPDIGVTARNPMWWRSG